VTVSDLHPPRAFVLNRIIFHPTPSLPNELNTSLPTSPTNAPQIYNQNKRSMHNFSPVLSQFIIKQPPFLQHVHIRRNSFTPLALTCAYFQRFSRQEYHIGPFPNPSKSISFSPTVGPTYTGTGTCLRHMSASLCIARQSLSFPIPHLNP
jgi:hypothetical protein